MSVLANFLQGREARRQQDAQDRMTAMHQYLGQNSGAIMAGDQAAMTELAGFGPEGLNIAMGMRDRADARDARAADAARADERLAIARANEARAQEAHTLSVQQHFASLDAEEQKAQVEEFERDLKVISGANTPEAWDAMAEAEGQPELIGQFEMKDALVRQLLDAKELFQAPEPAKPLTSLAKLKADLDAGLIDETSYNAAVAKELSTKSTKIESDGQGGFTMVEGYGLDGSTDERTTSSTNNAIRVNNASEALETELDRYLDLIVKHGIELKPGAAQDSLLLARRNIQMQMKELYNLGVLNGPDLMLMDQMIVDPTSLSSAAWDTASAVLGRLYSDGDIQKRAQTNILQIKDQMEVLREANTPNDFANPSQIDSGQRIGVSMDFSEMSDEELQRIIDEASQQ